jgi:hypothetical protein
MQRPDARLISERVGALGAARSAGGRSGSVECGASGRAEGMRALIEPDDDGCGLAERGRSVGVGFGFGVRAGEGRWRGDDAAGVGVRAGRAAFGLPSLDMGRM